MIPLKNAAEVEAFYAQQPRLLEGWLMVGYRQWYRRVHMRKPVPGKELVANKQLKSLTNDEWTALKKRVKSRLK